MEMCSSLSKCCPKRLNPSRWQAPRVEDRKCKAVLAQAQKCEPQQRRLCGIYSVSFTLFEPQVLHLSRVWCSGPLVSGD